MQLVLHQTPAAQTAEEYAGLIRGCWQRSAEAFIEAGRWLIEAKHVLPHGEFGDMIKGRLPFKSATAQRLMAIAADARLTNAAHVQHLPPHWGTLYELTKLSDEEIQAGFASGSIHPGLERKALINGARSLMAARREPDDSLDFFPTPPWGTRALIERVLPQLGVGELGTIWEPAAGEGHISGVLVDYGFTVYATDIFDYSRDGRAAPMWYRTLDFLGDEALMWRNFVASDSGASAGPDWIVTNPPFVDDKPIRFVERALEMARIGVAMFFRLQILDTIERYERIFRPSPPTLLAFFAERINLCKGLWDPLGSTATVYLWMVWLHGEAPRAPFWIPPGCREQLSRPDDVERYTCHPVLGPP